MESSCGSGEAKLNKLEDYINLFVNSIEALLRPHEWPSNYIFAALIMMEKRPIDIPFCTANLNLHLKEKVKTKAKNS